MARSVNEQTCSDRVVSDTPARILDSARILFQEKGYERTSMNDVAGRIGISAPSVYWHFKSKEVILYAILRSQIADFSDAVTAEVADAEPEDRIGAFVRSYVRYQLERLDQARGFTQIYGLAQLSHALSDEHLRDLRDLERSIVALVKKILEEGVDASRFVVDDISVTAFTIITMCENVTVWARPGGRLGPERIAVMIGDLVWRMVSAR